MKLKVRFVRDFRKKEEKPIEYCLYLKKKKEGKENPEIRRLVIYC